MCARWSAQVFLPTSLYVSVRTIRLAVCPVTPSASSAGSLFAFFAFLRFFDAPGIKGARSSNSAPSQRGDKPRPAYSCCKPCDIVARLEHCLVETTCMDRARRRIPALESLNKTTAPALLRCVSGGDGSSSKGDLCLTSTGPDRAAVMAETATYMYARLVAAAVRAAFVPALY